MLTFLYRFLTFFACTVVLVQPFSAFTQGTTGMQSDDGGPGPRIRLEETRTIMGTNPFDAKAIESIGLGDSYNSSPPHSPETPVYPDISLAPPDLSNSAPPGNASTSNGGAGPATTTTPFSVSQSGSISFSHTVRQSTCPQSAGGVSLTASNGAHINVSDIGVSGTIAPYLNVTVSGSGTTRPVILAEFNCGTSTPGTYSGTVSAVATDSQTGESQSLSIPASGQIN